jgi:hypothetical protein
MLKYLSVFNASLKMKRHFTHEFFMIVKPFSTAPGPLKGRDSPWSDVYMRALIQVEDILSICCELWLDKQ